MNRSSGVKKPFDVASGTLFLTVCTLIIKLIGFLYKIPLFNALGAKGAGLYQTVFPPFSLLVAIAVSGVPNGMTKIIASGKNANQVFKKSLKIFVPTGAIFSIFLYFLSDKIANFQGSVEAGKLYKLISISIFFVSLIAVLRGYFQGLSNLRPTALSQLIEQTFRAILGVTLFKLTTGDYYQKTQLAILAVTLSELFALAYLIWCYLRSFFKGNLANSNQQSEQKSGEGVCLKLLIATILPLTAIGLLTPLSGFIDSVTAINGLKGVFGDLSKDLYGSYSGSVQAIIGLPIAILHALAVGFLPKLARANAKGGQSVGEKKLLTATAVLSFMCYLAIILFSNLAVNLLFGKVEYKRLLSNLLRLSSINVIFSSMLSASNLILLAKGRQYFCLISMPLGLTAKTIINLTLLKNPKINIFGLIISDAGCYFVALFLNLLYIIYCNKKQKAGTINEDNACGHGRGQRFALLKRI